MKHQYIIVILLCLHLQISAQDFVTNHPLLPSRNNVSTTAFMPSKIRLGGLLDLQHLPLGTDGIAHSSFFYEQKMAIARQDYLGLGGEVYVESLAGSLKNTSILAKGALHKLIAKQRPFAGKKRINAFLNAGFALGYRQQILDYDNFRFSNQHNGRGSFNPSLPHHELFDGRQVSALDLSSGVSLVLSYPNHGGHFLVGANYSHLLPMNMSHIQNERFLISPRFTVHMSGEIILNTNHTAKRQLGLLLSALYHQQLPSRLLNPSLGMRFLVNQESNFSLRVGTRLVQTIQEPSSMMLDAISFNARIAIRNMEVSLSYDATISSLNRINNSIGDVSVGLVYSFGKASRGVLCPNLSL